jgi:hypothetical protein
MYTPVVLSEAEDKLNALVPDVFVVKFVNGGWEIWNRNMEAVAIFPSRADWVENLAKFFAESPESVEDLIRYAKELQKAVNSQANSIRDLTTKLAQRPDNAKSREVDRLRTQLNKAMYDNEELIKENKYLRGQIKRVSNA